MRPSLLLCASALTFAFGLALTSAPKMIDAGGPPPSLGNQPMVLLAANADNPYGNVDHRNDAGNDTGNGKVDQLNAGQLDRNFKGPYTYRGVGSSGQATTPASPGAAAAPSR